MAIGTYVVADVSATTASGVAFTIGLSADAWSPLPHLISRRVAPVASGSQAYYWTRVWQEGERESLGELEAGHGIVFANPRDLIRYLTEP